MANGIYSAVSGAVASMRQLDIIANNLANVSTPAFKASRAAFAEVLSAAQGTGAEPRPSYAVLDAERLDLSQGSLRQTGNALDVALEGPGYLVVRDGDRALLCRGGSLRLDSTGQVVDRDGRAVLGADDQPLRVGPDAGRLQIAVDGAISDEGARQIGRLKLVELDGAQQPLRAGDGLFQPPQFASLRPAIGTRVLQGQIEASNVNPIAGVTQMIAASRSYEAFNRVISSISEIDSRTTRELGVRA